LTFSDESRASHPITFSPDGRFVFTHYQRLVHGKNASISFPLVWWEVETAKRCGEVDDAIDMAVIDKSRVLVTRPLLNGQREPDDFHLFFWDTATGQQLRDWPLENSQLENQWIPNLIASENDRYLAVIFDPDFGQKSAAKEHFNDNAYTEVPPSVTRQNVLLLDVKKQQVVAQLPGCSAKFSLDGRWLATIDENGNLRVWDLPLRKPWAPIFGIAALGTLATSSGMLAFRNLFRRRKQIGR